MQKKTNLCRLVVVFVLLFILYGVSISPQNPINDWRVLNYLRLKYFKNFEIVELLNTTQGHTSGLWLDGTIISPSKKVGEYFYRYEVLSTSDDVKFYVYFYNKKGIGMYKDSYDVCREIDNTVGAIEDFVRETMGDESIEIRYIYADDLSESLNCDCEMQFRIAGCFKDVFSQEYVEDLYLIYQYLESTNKEFDNAYSEKSDGDVDFRLTILDECSKDRIELNMWRIKSRDYNFDSRVEDDYGWTSLESYLDYVEIYCTEEP